MGAYAHGVVVKFRQKCIVASSGNRIRPARVLLVSGGCGANRLARILRAEGYIVEIARDGAAVVERFVRPPPVDVIAIDGVADSQRTRALSAARESNVWCVYVGSRGATAQLHADERAAFVAALDMDADDAQIAGALRLVIAARRRRAADG